MSEVILSSTIKPEPKPLKDGDDVSWMNLCTVGDNQGTSSACTVFAMASWLEIMRGMCYSDMDCIKMSQAIKDQHDNQKGLSVPQAFEGMQKEHWFSDIDTLLPVQNLDAMKAQPIIAVYDWDSSWKNVSTAGCLDMDGASFVEDQHCVLAIAKGSITTGKPMVYIQNSHGITWGYKGCAMMTEKHHNKIIKEMWVVV